MKKRAARIVRDRRRGPRGRIRRLTAPPTTSFEDGVPPEDLPEYDTDRVVAGGEP